MCPHPPKHKSRTLNTLTVPHLASVLAPFSFSFFFPFSPIGFSESGLDFPPRVILSPATRKRSVTSYSNSLPNLRSQPFQSLPTGQLAGLYSQCSSRSAGTSGHVPSRGTEQLSHPPPGAPRCCNRPLSRACDGAAAISAPAPQRGPESCPDCPNQWGWSLKFKQTNELPTRRGSSFSSDKFEVAAFVVFWVLYNSIRFTKCQLKTIGKEIWPETFLLCKVKAILSTK